MAVAWSLPSFSLAQKKYGHSGSFALPCGNMNAVVETPPRVWTEAELQALPADGSIHEVVYGRLVVSPKNNFQHGDIASRLFLALGNHAHQHRMGLVLNSRTGFWMRNRNCRAPDISYVSRQRVKALGFKPSTQSFFPGAPDLAVEILSPGNTREEIDRRLKDFFESGARLVWIIDPNARRVEVCSAPDQRRFITGEENLEGGELLPDFRYSVADLFRDWD
jgi:Uma2 family endonuclease